MISREIFQQNLDAIKERIRRACQDANREVGSVSLLAVSKLQSSEAIRQAYGCGVRDFGENYPQELLQKQNELSDLPDIRWHLIGHLQRNKVKIAARCFAIHSLDSCELARKLVATLSSAAQTTKPRVYVQLEVEPTDENKFGIKASHAMELCAYLAEQKQLEWVGFMGIGPVAATSDMLRPMYKKFVDTGCHLWSTYSMPRSPQFSLGMSGDLEVAVDAGSHLVRIGTALFGERPKKI